MIELGTDICGNFADASSREWLETNGIGGYASSSLCGANTRRYHGLLVAATRPPLGRIVMLSKLEETVIVDGERFDLSSNQYPGTVHPEGYRYLKSFRLDPFPVWTFEVGGIEIERSLFMINGENSTVVQWRVLNGGRGRQPGVSLELRPLLAFRDHHHLRREDGGFDGRYDIADGFVSIEPCPTMPRLYLAHNARAVEHEGHWYRDLEYAIEMERGFDHYEDLYQPFRLEFDLAEDAVVIASTEQRNTADAPEYEAAEISRRQGLIEATGAGDGLTAQLVLAADQFIVARGTGKTVIAGYHWFSDWGRDTMIALSGLTLATGRPDVAKSVLTEFSKHISEGMLPNRFPDHGETPEYNTVDATLWFFEALRAYAGQTGDYALIREELYEKLVSIIDWHVRGTRYRIHVDTDGLLYAGEAGVQLTWMDAKIGDWVVTPRTGKPVEIQGLWYNALCIMSGFAERFDDTKRQQAYRSMAALAKASFNGQFWNDAEACLYDVVNGVGKDAAVRPNQIFAVSLANTMLDMKRARLVVDRVESELLTPFGLRSLSPKDPAYAGIYIGSPLERDAAYHQGTVWGWLIGPFVEAYLRVHSDDGSAAGTVDEIIAFFRGHIKEAMVGQVSEIFDGDPPHAARGCGAQAWSVAELLRIISIRSDTQ